MISGLDRSGACVAGDSSVSVYVSDGSDETATEALSFWVTVPTPPGGFRIEDAREEQASAWYLTGSHARGAICTDVSERADGDAVRVPAVSGTLVAEGESDAETGLPRTVRLTASDLVFEDGSIVPSIDVGELAVAGMPPG